jgi:hypothetical protein
MGGNDDVSAGRAASTLPNARTLILFAVLLPALLVVSNQSLLYLASRLAIETFFPVCLGVSIGLLGWCAGRFLYPAWLALLVFTWSVALLDLLTIIACMSGPQIREFAYVVMATQCGALAIWSTLADTGWQNRLPAALAAASMIILFAGFWDNEDWTVLLIVAAVVTAILGFALRVLGLRIAKDPSADSPQQNFNSDHGQFGTRHLLLWATAMSPFLIMTKGANYQEMFTYFKFGVLLAVLISSCVASAAFIGAWVALGKLRWPLRILATVATLALTALALESAVRLLFAVGILRPYRGYWPQDAMTSVFRDIQPHLYSWFGLLGALTAALFMFLRGQNYRLAKRTGAKSPLENV